MATSTREGFEQAKQTARQQGGAMWDDAKETARSALGEQQHAAASGLGDFARVLRNAAHQLEGEQRSSSVGRMAESAADGVERLSEMLRTRDLPSMARDAERFARNQPMVFFGAAVALGFLATRFLKASQHHEASEPHGAMTYGSDSMGQQGYGPSPTPAASLGDGTGTDIPPNTRV